MTNQIKEYTNTIRRQMLQLHYLDAIALGHYKRAYLIALQLEVIC